MNMSRTRGAVLIALTLCGQLACTTVGDLLHGRVRARVSDLSVALDGQAVSASDAGALRLLYDDLGGLRLGSSRSTAIPWPVLVAALVIDRESRIGSTGHHDPRAAFEEFGFVFADSIANLPHSLVRPAPDHPIGIVSAVAEHRLPSIKVEIANITCGACHAGVTYDATGRATRTIWIGLPNTSIDLQSYGLAAYRGLQRTVGQGRAETLLAMIDTLYPGMDPKERATLAGAIIPRMREQLERLSAGAGAPTTFDNGGPGFGNPAATMKYQLGLLDESRVAPDSGYESTPDFGFRHLRSTLYYDGGYTVPGRPKEAELSPADATDVHLRELGRVTSIFTVAVMGLTLAEASGNADAVTDMFHFIRDYRPPPFPGRLDSTLAARGAPLYASQCASCHGVVRDAGGRLELATFPNAVVSQSEMGTDATYSADATSSLLQRLRAGYARYATVDSTGKYAAPPLAGLWATAPYLHNGSVPTLWHLMHPGDRPQRFDVGGHRLDFDRVGIDLAQAGDDTMRYPEGYTPWSRPMLYDTRTPGRRNTGHAKEFGRLTESQKAALLEYLKRF
jgi:mono/diheme cytochrome c family protein